MDVHYEETTWGIARDGVPSAAEQRPIRLMALDHLAAGLQAACPETTSLTWAQVAQCTLSAAQHASTSAPTAGGMLTRRMVLNDGLYDAFMLRKHGQPWTAFDRPTLLLAVDDLIAAEHNRPAPDLTL